jgi:predicted nucleic acid-binding protein
VLEAWEAALESFVWTEVGIEDVVGEVDRLMARYGLASYDAIHAATAIARGIPRIVTLDAGFAAVPAAELSIYVDRSRLASCRSRRS